MSTRVLISDRSLTSSAAWWRWCAVLACVRLPAAMAPLVLVLAGRAASGSFAFGGVLAAAHAISEAALAAPSGRFIDRLRARDRHAAQVWIAGLLTLEAAAFAALAVTAAMGAAKPILLALTALAGGVASGVPGALRAELSELVSEDLLQRALAVDAVLLEAVWVAAPVLAAVLVAGVSATAALIAMACAAAAAAAMTLTGRGRGRTHARVPQQPARVRAHAGLLSRRAVAVLITSAAMGYAEGSIGVALPPMLEQLGNEPAAAGLLLAVLSAASIIGGLVYSRLHARWQLDAHRRADVLLALLAAGVIALSQAGSQLQLAVTVAAVGLVVAPLNATRSYAMQRSAPPGRQAEAFSLMYASMGGGWGLSGLGLGLLLGVVGADGALAVAGALALAVALVSLLVETLLPRGRRRARDAALAAGPVGERCGGPPR